MCRGFDMMGAALLVLKQDQSEIDAGSSARVQLFFTIEPLPHPTPGRESGPATCNSHAFSTRSRLPVRPVTLAQLIKYGSFVPFFLTFFNMSRASSDKKPVGFGTHITAGGLAGAMEAVRRPCAYLKAVFPNRCPHYSYAANR